MIWQPLKAYFLCPRDTDGTQKKKREIQALPLVFKKVFHPLNKKVMQKTGTFANSIRAVYWDKNSALQQHHTIYPSHQASAEVLCQLYLLTKSCSFCMGSGSPSRPQVSISLPSYTLMMRSAVFIRKQLSRKCEIWRKKEFSVDGKNA